MICKLIVVCLLVASPALSSGVKGHRDEPAVKGGAPLAPVRSLYREEAVKGHRFEAVKGHREEAIKGHREEAIKGQRREDPAPIKGRELAQQPEQLPAIHREEATKGRREEPTKGGRLVFAPVEQHRLIEQHQAIKSAQVKLEEPQLIVQKEELHQQREEAPTKGGVRLEEPQPAQRKLDDDWKPQQVVQKEELHQQKEELHQQKEELHQQREELQQQREESLGQQKLEEAPQPAPLPAAPTKSIRYEARPQVAREELAKGQQQIKATEELPREQKPWDDKLDLQQQLADSQQVELRQEEHQQQIQEAFGEQRRLTEISQQIEQKQEQYATKGQAPLVAPAGMAEPYAFDYSIEGSSRRESGDVNGVVRGQYTLQGADGSSRIVDYVADANGFRAQVNTNEAGTESKGAAGVQVKSSQPEAQDISLRLEGKTREFLNPPAAIKAPDVPPKPDNWQVKAPATKSAEPLPLPLSQQHIEQVELIAPKAPTKSLASRDEQQQQVEWTRLPAKGQQPLAEVQKLETIQKIEQVSREEKPLSATKRDEPLKEILQQQQQPASDLQESPKAAELRAPKSLLRSGFESATAHRSAVAAPRQVVRASPAHQVHQQRVSALPATRQQPARYEPSRYQHYAPAALPPVGAVDSDDSLASFERSS